MRPVGFKHFFVVYPIKKVMKVGKYDVQGHGKRDLGLIAMMYQKAIEDAPHNQDCADVKQKIK